MYKTITMHIFIMSLVCCGCGNKNATQQTVSDTNDPEELAAISVEAKDSSVRRAAVEKLSDQMYLEKLASDSPRKDDRRYAIEKLTNQTLLAQIATEDRSYSAREAACKALTGQKEMAYVASQTMTMPTYIRSLIERLTSQETLRDIALYHPVSYFRDIAIARLTDQEVLAKAVRANANVDTAVRAVQRMDDQKLLSDIVKDRDQVYGEKIRLFAIDKLLATDLLQALAQNANESFRIRSQAARRLKAIQTNPVK